MSVFASVRKVSPLDDSSNVHDLTLFEHFKIFIRLLTFRLLCMFCCSSMTLYKIRNILHYTRVYARVSQPNYNTPTDMISYHGFTTALAQHIKCPLLPFQKKKKTGFGENILREYFKV